MERFSIEVNPRRVAAGREASTPPVASPCKFADRLSAADQSAGLRNLEVRHPRDISPLSED